MTQSKFFDEQFDSVCLFLLVTFHYVGRNGKTISVRIVSTKAKVPSVKLALASQASPLFMQMTVYQFTVLSKT